MLFYYKGISYGLSMIFKRIRESKPTAGLDCRLAGKKINGF